MLQYLIYVEQILSDKEQVLSNQFKFQNIFFYENKNNLWLDKDLWYSYVYHFLIS